MKQALFATILFCIFYSLQIVFQQLYVRSSIHPLHLNFLSYLLISIAMTIYFSLFDKKAFSIKPDKKIFIFFSIALIGWMLADFFAVYGLKFSSSTNYSIISRLMVFVVFILSVLLLKEKSSFNKIIATIISIFGGILVIYKFNSKININIGDLFFLTTVFTQSTSSITRQTVTKQISAIHLTYYMFTFAAIILGIITFVFFPIKNIGSYKFIIFNALTGLIGFSMVNYAIQKGGAVFFTLVASLLPVFTAILSFLILKQLPLITQIIGGILIIFSIFIFTKK